MRFISRGGARSLITAAAITAAIATTLSPKASARQTAIQQRPNVIFILIDDLRFDAMGFMDPRLKTPNIDRLAKGGVHFRNAFVTTSLCSPSRATILTGRSTRNHRVVGNEESEPHGTVFFPQYLQQAGYTTAMIGKWHMGQGAQPRPGFDYWLSFAGQGVYLPNQAPEGEVSLNINGKEVPQKGYITDELTDYAIDWLDRRDVKKPFFLYLSHKGVHEEFTPAERDKAEYAKLPITLPASAADTAENREGKPRWVQTQRNSWHGADFPYYGAHRLDDLQRTYFGTISAVDDSVGRILDWLRKSGQDRNTVVFFMGDNGFLFGEHGLIDKRNAYEESMRVPLLAYGPGRLPAGRDESAMVANLDIAPTILDLAGLKAPSHFEGRSLMTLFAPTTERAAWRDHLVYEYYWDFALPHTPTTFAYRTDRYKYVTYHGVWDIDELYDLQADPREMRNLIFDPAHAAMRNQLRTRLFEELRNSSGDRVIPFPAKNRDGRVLRDPEGPRPGDFPKQWLRMPEKTGI